MKKIFTQKTLKKEMLIYDALIILIAFVLVVSATIMIYLNIFYDEIMLKNDTIAKSITYQINEHSEMHVSSLQNFSYNFENHLLVDHLTPNELLANLNANDKMFIKIQILSLDGIVLYSSSETGEDIGLDASGQPYVQSLKQSGDCEFSNSFLSRDLNKIVTAFSMRSDNYYYVALLDLEHFNDHLSSLNNVEEIRYFILDHTNTIIAASDNNYVNTRTKFNFLSRSKTTWGNYPLLLLGKKKYLINQATSDLLGWHVIILNDEMSVTQPVHQMIESTLSLAFVVLILYIIYKRRRIYYILNAIKGLKINFDNLAIGDYNVQLDQAGFNEFKELSTHFEHSVKEIEMREDKINALNNNLELQVEARTLELKNKNLELNNLVKELQSTQDLLIESEKQAAFSKLIAGVAHEINTPIGVSITSISFLTHKLEDLQEKYNTEQLSTEDFEEALAGIHESSILISRNLERAGELISSFKEASGNSFYDYITEYNLWELIDHLVTSLESNFIKSNCKIHLDVPNDLIIESYPSAMSQILTNLINNSIEHGFKNKENGEITIQVHEMGDMIKIVYRDNGHGISETHHNEIFEPFFTTDRASGGTGLGLSIVKNLIINKLSGSLSIDSEIDQYTAFTISLPKVLDESMVQ